MLKVGIVGLKNSKKYIDIIEKLEPYGFSGIYDPSFQIELSLYNSIEKGFLSYKQLVESCDVIIFSSDDKVFYPLMKDALANSKAVFLDSVHKLSYDQLNELSKLAYEANSFVEVNHSHLYHEITKHYQELKIKPIVVQENIEICNSENILKEVREELTLLLKLVGNKIRRIRTNVSSSSNAIPNIYQIVLEFNNGCMLNLLASSVGLPFKKDLRLIGQNSNSELNYNQHLIAVFNSNTLSNYQYEHANNTLENLITRQLEAIYLKHIDQSCFEFSLEHEMEASIVIQKITDKLKVCMSIV